MFSLSFVGSPNPSRFARGGRGGGRRSISASGFGPARAPNLHRNNRLITLLLSRTAWRHWCREIGRLTSEGCLRRHTATLVSISLEVFNIKYGYYVQVWAEWGSNHQQTRKLNSELIRKKLRKSCSNMSFKRKLRRIWDTTLGVFLSPVYIWGGLNSNTTLWIMP